MTHSSFNYIPYAVNVKPHQISIYKDFSVFGNNRGSHKNSLKNLETNCHNGRISNQAKKNIVSYINIILAQSKRKRVYHRASNTHFDFRVNFVTLTLSSMQTHSDTQIKAKVLKPFLDNFRKKFPNGHYFWRAEKQKNGNIHFHMVTDVFYHYIELREDWNKCQDNIGYIKLFAERYNHLNPNSTDVHSIKHIKNLGKYLAKYCTKEDLKNPVNGRNYGASEDVVRLCKVIIHEDEMDSEELNIVSKNNTVKEVIADSSRFYFGNIDKIIRNANGILSLKYLSNLYELQTGCKWEA